MEFKEGWGFGFIKYNDAKSVQKAIKELNNQNVFGKWKIKVE